MIVDLVLWGTKYYLITLTFQLLLTGLILEPFTFAALTVTVLAALIKQFQEIPGSIAPFGAQEQVSPRDAPFTVMVKSE